MVFILAPVFLLSERCYVGVVLFGALGVVILIVDLIKFSFLLSHDAALLAAYVLEFAYFFF